MYPCSFTMKWIGDGDIEKSCQINWYYPTKKQQQLFNFIEWMKCFPKILWIIFEPDFYNLNKRQQHEALLDLVFYPGYKGKLLLWNLIFLLNIYWISSICKPILPQVIVEELRLYFWPKKSPSFIVSFSFPITWLFSSPEILFVFRAHNMSIWAMGLSLFSDKKSQHILCVNSARDKGKISPLMSLGIEPWYNNEQHLCSSKGCKKLPFHSSLQRPFGEKKFWALVHSQYRTPEVRIFSGMGPFWKRNTEDENVSNKFLSTYSVFIWMWIS